MKIKKIRTVQAIRMIGDVRSETVMAVAEKISKSDVNINDMTVSQLLELIGEEQEKYLGEEQEKYRRKI